MVFYRRIFTALLCTPVLFPLTASIATDLRDHASLDDLSSALMGIEKESTDPRSALPLSPSASSETEIGGTKATVRFGDTLEMIAARHGLSVDQLMRLNPELSQSPLIVGRQLRLQASPGTTRIHSWITLRPSTSGGASWPETPSYDRSPGQPMEGRWLWPANGVFTSAYGWRWGRMHKGIDIANNVGTPILAAQDGQVTFAGWNDGGYGYLVEITHPDGSRSLYAHQSRILVQVGEEVSQGQQIGQMGSTGRSTGPHLHFEIHAPGLGAVNPMRFLQPSA
jgi:murein DD-endopeptidase MepM/ murein hydrolase activator NlpD